MRMRVRTCAQSYCSCVLNKIMPPKGGSERSELSPCHYTNLTFVCDVCDVRDVRAGGHGKPFDPS